MSTFKGKCPAHQRKAWENPSQHTLQMDRSLEYQWRKKVMTDPTGGTKLCENCGQSPAKRSDHKVPVGEGGALYDPSNGWALCIPCDDTKTTEDLARMARSRRSKSHPA
ncbi:hypothetical protein [Cryobacterium sp. AP23]